MTGPRIGSLFSGYGGLDSAVEAVFGGTKAWVSDIDPGANRILAHHWPDVPNLGDITAVNWDSVEPVDIITGGFPCQDVSMAGRRAGMGPGTRSGLWSAMANAIDHLRPSLVIAENVRGLLSAAADSDVEPCPWCLGDATTPDMRALGAVLGDLADLGYDAAWYGLTAASVGAPHGRFRVFIVAWPDPDTARIGRRAKGRDDGLRVARLVEESSPVEDADCPTCGQRWQSAPGQAPRGWAWAHPRGSDRALPADADIAGLQGAQPASGRLLPNGGTTADPQGDGRDEWWSEPAGIVGRPNAAVSGDTPVADSGSGRRQRRAGVDQPRRGAGEWSETSDHPSDGHISWGQFEPAVRRWERLTRPVTAPTETGAKGGQRLSPRFVEWMMGLPAGHVTEVPGLNRNAQLKALGNGVVPRQAETAIRHLLGMLEQVA